MLSKQKKTLLMVTVVVFCISAALITQTYFTMQVFNAADAACKDISPQQTLDEVKAISRQHQLPFRLEGNNASLGFHETSNDNCGCEIELDHFEVKSVGQTYCR